MFDQIVTTTPAFRDHRWDSAVRCGGSEVSTSDEFRRQWLYEHHTEIFDWIVESEKSYTTPTAQNTI